MKNRIVRVFGMVAVLLTLISCSLIMIDEDVVASWENVPVEELDTHSFFITIPMIKTISDGGVEIRNYRNGVCNNLFYIKNGLVKEYRLTGSCRTVESLRPESNSF